MAQRLVDAASQKDGISAMGIMMRLLPAIHTPEYRELRGRIADLTEFRVLPPFPSWIRRGMECGWNPRSAAQ